MGQAVYLPASFERFSSESLSSDFKLANTLLSCFGDVIVMMLFKYSWNIQTELDALKVVAL